MDGLRERGRNNRKNSLTLEGPEVIATNLHLEAIAKAAAEGAHPAVLPNATGHHRSAKLEVRANITLI